QMWEAARDLALENPRIPPDVLMRVMEARRRASERRRIFPEVDETLENMLLAMANLLIIEVFAYDTFDWGERLLSDSEISAEPERAGEMVRHIRSDENPHIEYLRAALSELRLRTIAIGDGRRIPGRTVVDGIIHRSLAFLMKNRPKQQRENVRERLAEVMAQARNPKGLIERFDALETRWTAPERTGFEPVPRDGAAS
ncbi:MAG: hypothetical protein ACRD1Z_07495, partial [Vicinamibacteria bacterium]